MVANPKFLAATAHVDDGAVREGHPWIFSGAIASGLAECAPGDPVRVRADDGRVLGTGYGAITGYGRALLDGILGADRAGFHAERWATAFMDCCAVLLGAEGFRVLIGREVSVLDAPLGDRVGDAVDDLAQRELAPAGEL